MFTPPKFTQLWSVCVSVWLMLGLWLVGRSGWQDYTASRRMTPAEQAYQRLVLEDARLAVLAELFREYDSPLLGQEAVFIQMADKYRLPWTLLPAIAGKESSFGKRVPYYRGRLSYNPFGWGVTGGKVIAFNSWAEAIETVAKGLRDKYFDKGLDTIAKIERYYTPPSYYGSGHWRRDVTYLSQRLERDYQLKVRYLTGDVFLGLNRVLTDRPLEPNMKQ